MKNNTIAIKLYKIAETSGTKIVSGLQPEDTISGVLKRSVAPFFDMKGFQPFLWYSVAKPGINLISYIFLLATLWSRTTL